MQQQNPLEEYTVTGSPESTHTTFVSHLAYIPEDLDGNFSVTECAFEHGPKAALAQLAATHPYRASIKAIGGFFQFLFPKM